MQILIICVGKQLGVQAILSVFLAAFCGFGTAIVGTMALSGLVKFTGNSLEARPQSSESPPGT